GQQSSDLVGGGPVCRSRDRRARSRLCLHVDIGRALRGAMDDKTVVDFPATGRRRTALQLIANMIWRLNYDDLLTFARDLHADSDAIGKSPYDIADLLSRWASRQFPD